MLDTNIVSHVFREHPLVTQRLVSLPLAALCISAITEGELLAGLAKRPQASRLRRSIDEFRRRVDVFPWDRDAASRYGTVKAAMALAGQSLGALDLLIAAHAMSLNAVLVTNDQALSKTPGLATEDWTATAH